MAQAVLRVVKQEDGEKKQALEAALSQIDRAFGKGSVMRLGQRESIETEVVSTGSLGLDIALGIGGYPRGRIVEPGIVPIKLGAEPGVHAWATLLPRLVNVHVQHKMVDAFAECPVTASF